MVQFVKSCLSWSEFSVFAQVPVVLSAGGCCVTSVCPPALPLVSVRDQPSDVWGPEPGQSLDSGQSRSRGVLIMSVSPDPELLREHNTLSSQLQTVTVTTQRVIVNRDMSYGQQWPGGNHLMNMSPFRLSPALLCVAFQGIHSSNNYLMVPSYPLLLCVMTNNV